MKYGDKIRFVRTKVRDITLNDLAKMSGLSVSYLSDAELGRSNMSIKSLEKVADALNVSSSYLLDENAVTFKEIVELSKEYTPPTEIMDFLASQEKLPYLVLAKKLSDEGLSPEALEIMFNNIKLMMNSLNK